MWELQKKKKKRERDAWVLSEDSHLVCLDENLLSAFSQVSMILIHSRFTNNWDHFQFICFSPLHFQFPSFMIDLPISASSCPLGQWHFSHVPPQLPASGPPPGHDSCFLIFWSGPSLSTLLPGKDSQKLTTSGPRTLSTAGNRATAWFIPLWGRLKAMALSKGLMIDTLKKIITGTSLVVQWLRLHAPNAASPGSVPVQRTRSHMPQLKPGTAR